MARVEHLEALRAAQLNIADVLDNMRAMLRSGAQRLSLAVRDNDIIDGVEDYWALRYLGAKMAAISEGAREEVNVSLEALGLYDDVMGRSWRAYGDILEMLAYDRPTPLLRLRGSWGSARVWAKLEWYNPLSLSIKDRAAWYMASLALDKIKAVGRIYEASSSNTGVALAAIAAVLGVRARIYIPETAADFGPAMVRLFGGEAVVRGSSTNELRPVVAEDARREGALMLDQFANLANPFVHVRYTAKEIEAQANRAGLRLRGVFVTMGTGGHAAGISFYFRNRRPDVKVYGVQPDEGGRIPGIKRQDFSSWWPLGERPHEVIEVSAEEAMDAAIEVAKTNGILFGVSGGAAVAALRKSVDRLEEGDYVVIIPDHGIKYLDLYLSHLGAGSEGG